MKCVITTSPGRTVVFRYSLAAAFHATNSAWVARTSPMLLITICRKSLRKAVCCGSDHRIDPTNRCPLIVTESLCSMCALGYLPKISSK